MVARLGLSSHTLSIERNRGGHFSMLSAGGSVAPEEALRFGAQFGFQWSSSWMHFSILDAEGQVVWGPDKINTNLQGNAWVDVQAPIEPGTYTLVGEATEGFPGSFGLIRKSHSITRTFKVSAGAPPVPGGGSILPGGVGDLFATPWTWIIILGALLALGLLI
jgi:hypothetical protein